MIVFISNTSIKKKQFVEYLSIEARYHWRCSEGLTKNIEQVPKHIVDEIKYVISKGKDESKMSEDTATYKFWWDKTNGLEELTLDMTLHIVTEIRVMIGRFNEMAANIKPQYLDEKCLYWWNITKGLTISIFEIPNEIVSRFNYFSTIHRHIAAEKTTDDDGVDPISNITVDADEYEPIMDVKISKDDMKILDARLLTSLRHPKMVMFDADIATVTDIVCGVISETLDDILSIKRIDFYLCANGNSRRYVVIDRFDSSLVNHSNVVYVAACRYTGNDERILGLFREEKIIYFVDILSDLQKWINWCDQCPSCK